MTRVTPAIQSFSGGIAQPEVQNRTDLASLLSSAAVIRNWLPRPNGSMLFRPGFERMGTASGASRMEAFTFDTDVSRVLEFGEQTLRIWSGDSRVARAAQTITITDGDWSSLTNWTVAQPGLSTATISSNELTLVADTHQSPTVTQEITAAAGTHAIKVAVVRGPVAVRAGAASGDSDFGEYTLRTGEHHLNFSTTGSSFFLQFTSDDPDVERIIGTVEVASAADVVVTTPWAAADLHKLRWAKSNNVIYMSCDGYPVKQIERRSNDSWSVVDYNSVNGPYISGLGQRTTLTPSDSYGNITLTASRALFSSSHVGALFSLAHKNQMIVNTLSAVGQRTDWVRVTGGAQDDRVVYVTISGTFSGTIQLERAYADPVRFSDWSGNSYTGAGTAGPDETQDDRIVYVRAYASAWTSGAAIVKLEVKSGESEGVVRITGVTNSTTASAEVVFQLGDDTVTDLWREGAFSGFQGYPTECLLSDGRFWLFSFDTAYASYVEEFENFDPLEEGDSRPIVRQMQSQSSDVIWATDLRRIIISTSASTNVLRSNSLDEPLTDDNLSVDRIGSRGSSGVRPGVMDQVAFSMDRDEVTPLLTAYSLDNNRITVTTLNDFAPDILEGRVSQIAVQRRPWSRVFYVTKTGGLVVLSYDEQREIQGWSNIDAEGFTFESVAVKMADTGEREDSVWAIVNDGSSRVIWRLMPEWECRGASLSKNVDDATIFSSPGSATLTGLDHLDGEFAVGWVDGAPYRSDVVVSGGELTLSSAPTDAVIGRAYPAIWRGVKAAYGGQEGSALNVPKQIERAGLSVVRSAIGGLSVGVHTRDETNAGIAPVSLFAENEQLDGNTVYDQLELPLEVMNSEMRLDPRLQIENIAPFPVHIAGVTMMVSTDIGGPEVAG